MQTQLVAIDVDGTLINDDYQLTDRTKAAISHIKEYGMKVILATGRGPRSCAPLLKELNITDPIITHNGAVILDPKNNEVSLEIGFSAHDLLPVIQYCRDRHIHFDANTAFDMYIENVIPEAEAMYQKFYVTPNRIKDTSLLQEQIVKFSLFAESRRLDQVMEEIVPLFPDWSVIRSGEVFIDIIHPQATKGTALRHLMEEYGCQSEQVMAFGNYYNDVEMIQLAGTGIAMENSPQQIRQLADRVTYSNNEDGVAVVLEELVEGLSPVEDDHVGLP